MSLLVTQKMTEKLTKREIQNWIAKIGRMEYEEMAVMWRFAPSGHPCFNMDYPQIHDAFRERFNNYFNGMRADISKHVGFDRSKWVGKYGIKAEE